MRPARDVNSLPIGIAVIALVVLLFYVALNVSRVPFLGGGGTAYSAAFSEAAGLRAGNDVLVGGVKVGQVDGVTLEGTHVRVAFRVNGVHVGSDPRLTIGIGTLLGNKFLDLQPSHTGKWNAHSQIPLDHTTSPYDVVPAFADVTRTVQAIDTKQVADAFRTMADTFRDAPPDLRSALDGVSRLSLSITSRDQALAQLLADAQVVTGTLADRKQQLTQLMGDGSALLQELDARRDAVSRLLTGTAQLAEQLRGMVQENQAVVKPALNQLAAVTDILERNQNDLKEFLHLIYPTTRMLVDTTGQGPWFDGILGGVTPVPEIPGLPVNPPVVAHPGTLGELLGVPTTAGAR